MSEPKNYAISWFWIRQEHIYQILTTIDTEKGNDLYFFLIKGCI